MSYFPHTCCYSCAAADFRRRDSCSCVRSRKRRAGKLRLLSSAHVHVELVAAQTLAEKDTGWQLWTPCLRPRPCSDDKG